MKRDKLLNVLNGMELLDWSCSCGECEYVIVEDTKDNREALLAVGLREKDIGKYVCEGAIDISMIAWEKTDANYWSKEKGFRYKKIIRGY